VRADLVIALLGLGLAIVVAYRVGVERAQERDGRILREGSPR
jgi:hypothetical protein